MKIFPVIVAAIGLLLGISCERRGSTASPKPSGSPAEQTEEQLTGRRNQLVEDLSKEKKRMDDLRGEILKVEDALAEIRPKLERLDAAKKKMTEDVIQLKRRWEKEIEGFHEAPSRPIHEIFHEMTRKVDQLLQENEDLKRKLEAAPK